MTQSSPFSPDQERPATNPTSNSSIFKEVLRLWKMNWGMAILFSTLYLFSGAGMAFLSPTLDNKMPTVEYCKTQPDVEACHKVKKEEIKAEAQKVFDEITSKAPLFFLVYIIFIVVNVGISYTFSMAYLQRAMKSPPVYSLKGFGRYLRIIVWKYIRPILWILIPILGLIPYTRSIIRNELAGPLTLLGNESPLRTSWERTKGNVWRIFGIQFGLIIIYYLFTIFCMFISFLLLTRDPLIGLIVMTTAIIISAMIFSSLYMFVPFATFRVLAQESKAKEAKAAS